MFYVDPPLTLTITAVDNVKNATRPLLATIDTVSVQYTLGGALRLPSTAAVAYDVGYIDSTGLRQSVALLQDRQTSFKCPYVGSTASNLTVYVDLLINSVLTASATQAYPVALLSATDMTTTQEAVLHTTDPNERADAASNIAAALKELSSDEQQRFGLLLLDTLADILIPTSNTSSSSSTGGGVSTNRLLATLDSVLSATSEANSNTTATNTTNKQAMTTKAKLVMESLVGSVKESNVKQMLNTVDKFDPDADASRLVSKMAASLSDQIALGVVVVASTNRTKLVATKATGAGLSGTSLQPSPTTNITMATLGTDPTSEFAVNVIESVVRLLLSRSGRPAKQSSNTLTINVRQNNKPFAVKGLTDKIRFTMTSEHPETDECNYYDEENTGEWAKNGVGKDSFNAAQKSITCASDHLTSFAIFPSSTSGTNEDLGSNSVADVAVPSAIGMFVVIVAAIIALVFHFRRRRVAASDDGLSLDVDPSREWDHQKAKQSSSEVVTESPVPSCDAINVLFRPSRYDATTNPTTNLSNPNPLTARKFSTVRSELVTTQDIDNETAEEQMETEMEEQQLPLAAELNASVLDQRKCSVVAMK